MGGAASRCCDPFFGEPEVPEASVDDECCFNCYPTGVAESESYRAFKMDVNSSYKMFLDSNASFSPSLEDQKFARFRTEAFYPLLVSLLTMPSTPDSLKYLADLPEAVADPVHRYFGALDQHLPALPDFYLRLCLLASDDLPVAEFSRLLWSTMPSPVSLDNVALLLLNMAHLHAVLMLCGVKACRRCGIDFSDDAVLALYSEGAAGASAGAGAGAGSSGVSKSVVPPVDPKIPAAQVLTEFGVAHSRLSAATLTVADLGKVLTQAGAAGATRFGTVKPRLYTVLRHDPVFMRLPQ